MDIFHILHNIYVNRKGDWINELEESEIQPFLINRWLSMNNNLQTQTRWLDQYVFCLPPKMYLSLAWSIIPKADKAPFVKYIKQKEVDEEYDFILDKIRHQYHMSDNDFNKQKDRLISYINMDKINWFKFYGIEKKYWKKHLVDFKEMKKHEEKKQPTNKWFG